MDEVGIPFAEINRSASGLTVKWLGVTTLLIDDGSTQIMTDGFISRPNIKDIMFFRPIEPDLEAIERAINSHQIDRLAAIMPVHSHYDHSIDSAEIARMTNADLLGSMSTINIARSSFLSEKQIKTIDVGKSYSYGNFLITFLESTHAPLITNFLIEGSVEKPFDIPKPFSAWKEGKTYTVYIEHPEGSILVQASAGFIPGMLDNLEADVVFLGTGGLKQLSTDYISNYVLEVVHAVSAGTVYVIHHDNMFGKFGETKQSRIAPSFGEIEAFSLKQMVMPAQLRQPLFGEPIKIDAQHNTKKKSFNLARHVEP